MATFELVAEFMPEGWVVSGAYELCDRWLDSSLDPKYRPRGSQFTVQALFGSLRRYSRTFPSGWDVKRKQCAQPPVSYEGC
ncbi:hypothetical protein KQX54_004611 [Cotesia glomerata]|uniref:Uncharacterized protein n=1 Tax=Cotesia glomerata TaxID=32391 RepID=A0AAV7HZ00_COTGL|nr:hypothetical protein KQX54_004611 [Cotesia glomerata]